MTTMSLAILASGAGSHVVAWLHPATNPRGGTDIGHDRHLARLAEAGTFDLFFVADTPAARTEKLDGYACFPLFMNVFEPVTLLSALAGATSDLPLDDPIPRASNLHQTYSNRIVEMIRTEGPTLRQLYLRFERGNTTLCRSVRTVADQMQEWFEGGAADGFMLNFPTLPDGLEAFMAHVVPELRRRGLFRTAYAGPTLRDHLGLVRPPNRFTAAKARLPAAG